MNRDQIIMVLKVLKTNYPRFYADMTKEEAEDLITLWAEMFEHDNPQIVIVAVKNLIINLKWPPTIADVKQEMYKLTDTDTESPIEIWNSIKKAMCNGIYNSQKEFDLLPELAKKFVGTPRQLREWAIADDYNDGVVRGQFLKQYEILKQREKDNKMMLPSTKDIISRLTNAETEVNLLN